MNLVSSRACPSCSQSRMESGHDMTAKNPAEELDRDSLRDLFVGFRRENSFFSYSRCKSCQLLFCSKYFSDDFLGKLYESMPQNTTVSGENDSQKTQERYSRFFLQTPPKFRYLELGPDIGLLTRKIRSEKNPASISVIEPNRAVHDSLRKNAGDKVEIYDSIMDLPANRKFDIVSAVHVLDHLTYPLKELEKLRSHMTNHSQIVIVIHNEKSLLRHLLGRKWPPFCLQHPQLFNRSTVRDLLDKAGFRTKFIKRTVNYIGLNQVIDHAKSLGFLGENVKLPLPNWSIPIMLGNIVVVAEPNAN